jgi:hypothetical protein
MAAHVLLQQHSSGCPATFFACMRLLLCNKCILQRRFSSSYCWKASSKPLAYLSCLTGHAYQGAIICLLHVHELVLYQPPTADV